MNFDDKDIFTAIGKNPEYGFKMLIEKYKRPIYWHIRRLLVSHDDSQDVAQETFLRLFRAINQFKNNS